MNFRHVGRGSGFAEISCIVSIFAIVVMFTASIFDKTFLNFVLIPILVLIVGGWQLLRHEKSENALLNIIAPKMNINLSESYCFRRDDKYVASYRYVICKISHEEPLREGVNITKQDTFLIEFTENYEDIKTISRLEEVKNGS